MTPDVILDWSVALMSVVALTIMLIFCLYLATMFFLDVFGDPDE